MDLCALPYVDVNVQAFFFSRPAISPIVVGDRASPSCGVAFSGAKSSNSKDRSEFKIANRYIYVCVCICIYNPSWLKPYGLEQPMCRIKWKTQGHFIKTTFWETEQHTFKFWYSVRPSRWLNPSYKAAFPLGFIRPKIRVSTIIVNVRFLSFIIYIYMRSGIWLPYVTMI